MALQGLWITLGVAIFAVFMLVIERKYPGRKFPIVSGWMLRAICINIVQIAALFAAGIGWNGWMLRNHLWSAASLGMIAGSVLGYLVLTFIFYWWHLLRHRSDFLWRWLHQIHHSAQRLELLTAFYKRPAEIIIDAFLSSAILYLIIGLEPLTAAVAMTLSGVGELVYHWNVLTPYWLGFVFQRPESHLVHHEEGLHDYNYSDLPLWDMLFGTFRNPREWNGSCGFGPGRETQLFKMLLGVDLSRAA